MSDPLEKTSPFRVPPDISNPTSCVVGGCRLGAIEGTDEWRHFGSARSGQDARGCRTACVVLIHGGQGRPQQAAVSA